MPADTAPVEKEPQVLRQTIAHDEQGESLGQPRQELDNVAVERGALLAQVRQLLFVTSVAQRATRMVVELGK